MKSKSGKKYDINAAVVQNTEVKPGIFVLTVNAPEIAASAMPGQFVYVKPLGSQAPLLRRAFSIARVEKNHISVCFDVKGEGTALLSACARGNKVRVLGPCGHGFPLENTGAENILIAGGMGIAPMVFLAQRLKSEGKKVRFFFGTRTRNQLVLTDAIKKESDSVAIATEDGSSGRKGYITECLPKAYAGPVFACGPNPMLKAISKIYPHALVSVETRMACGAGVCMGCGVAMKDKTIKRCCVEGPVFVGSEVAWD